MSEIIETRIVRRPASDQEIEIVDADICVLGAGISGVTAAIEAANTAWYVTMAG